VPPIIRSLSANAADNSARAGSVWHGISRTNKKIFALTWNRCAAIPLRRVQSLNHTNILALRTQPAAQTRGQVFSTPRQASGHDHQQIRPTTSPFGLKWFLKWGSILAAKRHPGRIFSFLSTPPSQKLHQQRDRDQLRPLPPIFLSARACNRKCQTAAHRRRHPVVPTYPITSHRRTASLL